MHSVFSYSAVGVLNFYHFAFYKTLQGVKTSSFGADRSTAFCFINWTFVQSQKLSALFYKILRTEEKHNISSTYPTLNSVLVTD